MPFCVWHEYCRPFQTHLFSTLKSVTVTEQENLHCCIYIPVGEEPGMQTARGQSALPDIGTCVLHCIKLFQWSMTLTNINSLPG